MVVVATRSPERGKPFSGGMAPSVQKACKGYDYTFWYGYGEIPTKTKLGRTLMGAFNGWFDKSVNILAQQVEGFRIRKVEARDYEWDLQYNEFCNRWVWPICHNLVEFAKAPKLWDGFGNRHANAVIAKRIKEDLGNDTETPIWIHDYHHLMLAQALRRLGVINPIVYFHHIPLPTLETLDTQGARDKAHFIDMLQPLRACDAVMFQTETIAKRFFDLVDEEAPDTIPAYSGTFIDSKGENVEGRQTYVGHAPISVDLDRELEVAQQPLATDEAKKLDDKLVADFVFINFERCDYSKGILQRVQAFEKLITERPDLKGKVQLLLGAEPTREGIEEYTKYKDDVMAIVERINANEALHIDGQPPVIFNNERIAHDDVVRMLRSSKKGQKRIGLVTSHEDGMNLTSKEFVAAQDFEHAAPLIISNGVGAAAELVDGDNGAIEYISHANDLETTTTNICAAMVQAIEMPQDEANKRARFMLRALRLNDLDHWARNFSNLFDRIKNNNFGKGLVFLSRRPQPMPA